MSWRAVQWAIPLTGINPAAKLTLIQLADFASHDDGLAFPAVARLVRLTGLSARTVQRALADLAAAGWIAVEANGGRIGGRGRATCYRLAIPAEPLKGDTVTPFANKAETPKGDTVTPFKPKRVTNPTLKGDTVTPQPKREPKSQYHSLRSWRSSDRLSCDKARKILWSEGVAWLDESTGRRSIRQSHRLMGELLRRAGGGHPEMVLEAIQQAAETKPADVAAYLMAAMGGRHGSAEPADDDDDLPRFNQAALDAMDDDGVTLDAEAEEACGEPAAPEPVAAPPAIPPKPAKQVASEPDAKQQAVELLRHMSPTLSTYTAGSTLDLLLPKYGNQVAAVVADMAECMMLDPPPDDRLHWLAVRAHARAQANHPGIETRQ